jgi:hypothetical protein
MIPQLNGPGTNMNKAFIHTAQADRKGTGTSIVGISSRKKSLNIRATTDFLYRRKLLSVSQVHQNGLIMSLK